MKSLAEQVFEANPKIESEGAVLAAGFDVVRQVQGLKTARYYFWYDEDFPSDFVTEYRWMQRQPQAGV